MKTQQMLNGGKKMPTRAEKIGNYIVENNATVRQAASTFRVSKSTVHQDITDKLKDINDELYQQVRKVLDTNKAERHVRGGEATKAKYAKQWENLKR